MFQQQRKKEQRILLLSQNKDINLNENKGTMPKYHAMKTYVETEVQDCTDPSMNLDPRPNLALEPGLVAEIRPVFFYS
jgi:hypothetical protein